MTIATAPYTALVAGSPVNLVAGSLSVQRQIGQRSTGSVQVWGPLGQKWQYGTQIQILDDVGATAFNGYISLDHAERAAGARQGVGFLEHTLTLMDNCYRADKRVIWVSYLNAPAGFIAQDLVNRVLYQEGVTYTATSIAAGVGVPEAIWNGKQISAALDWLSKNSGYWWNIDDAGVLWFQPYGGIPAPFPIDGTQVDSTKNFSVDFGSANYVNTQYTKGGNAEKGSKRNPLVESFIGDGLRRSFTLSYPISSLYQITLNGVDITAQSLAKGSSGGQVYYARGDAVIAQDPSQAVLQPSDTLVVYYSGRVPAVGKAQNSALIATQKAREGGSTSGIVESVYSDTKVHTLPAALQIASALLAHYGHDVAILNFDTMWKGLVEGQSLSVNLPDFGLNQSMLITNVNILDQGSDDVGVNIWFHITAVGSPYDVAQWQTLWQNMMNQQTDPADLSDVNDLQFTPIVTSTFTHTPSFTTTGFKTVGPICGVSMLCGSWTVA